MPNPIATAVPLCFFEKLSRIPKDAVLMQFDSFEEENQNIRIHFQYSPHPSDLCTLAVSTLNEPLLRAFNEPMRYDDIVTKGFYDNVQLEFVPWVLVSNVEIFVHSYTGTGVRIDIPTSEKSDVGVRNK